VIFETGEKKVLETYVRETNELVKLTISGAAITTTTDHPFYAKNTGFVNAGDLRVGDKLLDNNCDVLIIESAEREVTETPVKVYNFQVEDWHTYHAGENGVLVHNAGYQPQNPPNFKEVKDLDDFKSRIPENATEKPFIDLYPFYNI